MAETMRREGGQGREVPRKALTPRRRKKKGRINIGSRAKSGP